MKLKDIIPSGDRGQIDTEFSTPIFNWIILVTSVFTAFAFWGWIASSLLEYGQREGIKSSTVYFIIMVLAVGLMFLAYVLYYIFVKRSSINIPHPKEPRRKN